MELFLYRSFLAGWEGTLGCWLHWSPKFYNTVVLFIGSTTLGTLVNFNVSVQTFQPLIVNNIRGNFVYHHWGCALIYQHCLIPLDSCFFLECLERWGVNTAVQNLNAFLFYSYTNFSWLMSIIFFLKCCWWWI